MIESGPEKYTGVELVPPEEVARLALEQEPGRDTPFSLYAGVNFVSMYVSRGLVFSSEPA